MKIRKRRGNDQPSTSKTAQNVFKSAKRNSNSKSKKILFLASVSTCLLITFVHMRVVTKRFGRNAARTIHNSTYFESRGDNLRYKCTLKAGMRKHNPSQKDALARIIPFQSNGAHQLKNFMAYYSQVIDMDNIVIIDHQTRNSNADSYTASLLHKYNTLGSDIWHCEGSFDLKSEMWSWVIDRYKDKSEFVFPLDVDEYIAVLKTTPKQANNDGEHTETEVLSWNKQDLSNALHKLQRTGKPFKLEQGAVYPVDCDDNKWSKAMSIHDNTLSSEDAAESLLHFDVGPMQKVKYVARRKTNRDHCMDKVFMRGEDFNITDTGNHFGQTHKTSIRKQMKRCRDTTVSTFVPDIDQKNDLFMIHMQAVNFDEWLTHAFRGAADRGFNRFTRLKTCTKFMTSLEYCESWQALMKTNFDPKEMKKMYRDEVCGKFSNREHIPLPINQLIQP